MTSRPDQPAVAASTNLVIVDVQHWITRLPLAPRSGPQVAQACAGLRHTVRAAGGRVIHVRYLRLDGSDGGPDGPSTQIVPALTPAPDEPVVDKHGIDAFDGTELDRLLRSNHPSTVIVAGIATTHAVAATAVTAARAGYRTLVYENTTACLDATEHVTSLRQMAQTGVQVEARQPSSPGPGRFANNISRTQGWIP